MSTKEIGDWGEKIALDYFTKREYTFVKKGFRSRFGEIDLIVKNKDFLVFVEVKVRKDSSFAQAREFVSKNKQRKIRTTAQLWLSRAETGLQPRFDVLEIYAPEGSATKEPEIIHIDNAFQ